MSTSSATGLNLSSPAAWPTGPTEKETDPPLIPLADAAPAPGLSSRIPVPQRTLTTTATGTTPAQAWPILPPESLDAFRQTFLGNYMIDFRTMTSEEFEKKYKKMPAEAGAAKMARAGEDNRATPRPCTSPAPIPPVHTNTTSTTITTVPTTAEPVVRSRDANAGSVIGMLRQLILGYAALYNRQRPCETPIDTAPETLDIRGLLLTASNKRAFVEELKCDTTLLTLNLEGWVHGPQEITSLAEALKANTTLTSLWLEYGQKGADAAPRLFRELSSNTTLTTLHLSANIAERHTIALADAMNTIKTLKSLKLAFSSLGSEGFKTLAQNLGVNTTVTTFDLAHCDIGAEGASALAEALKINPCLKTLNLDRNQIGDDGAIAFAEALTSNSGLTTLDLSDNEIGDNGFIAIAEALKENSTLTLLQLDENDAGDKGEIAIADALKCNKNLRSLHLDGSKLGDSGTLAIADAVKNNSTLTTLKISVATFTVETLTALDEAMKYNTTLTTIEFPYLRITPYPQSTASKQRIEDLRGSIEAAVEHNRQLPDLVRQADAVLTLMTRNRDIPSDICALLASALGALPNDMDAFKGTKL